MNHAAFVLVLLAAVLLLRLIAAAGGAPPGSDPKALALYKGMAEAMGKAKTLSYRSEYAWRGEKDALLGHCTYRITMKKPNFVHIDGESIDGKRRGVLVGDGAHFWIFWPGGMPRYGFMNEATYEKTKMTSYKKEAAPRGGHSLAHSIQYLGIGACMTVIEPSLFHGSRDSMEQYLDGVRLAGTETYRGKRCRIIEASFMSGQRSRRFWFSGGSPFPLKMKEVVRVRYDIVTTEEWFDLKVDAPAADGLFAWSPPAGWTEFRVPTLEEGLLKPGAEAPDFDLPTVDGGRFRLSAARGKVVWLYIWRVG